MDLPFLILSHAHDGVAASVAAALRQRHGPERVRLVSAADLGLAPRLSHRARTAGAETEIDLVDGTRLSSRRIGVVLNRIEGMLAPPFFSSPDRAYATAELHAFVLSWLACLPCPVVNAAGPRGLAGPRLGLSEWLLLAGRSGLPTAATHVTTNARRYRAAADCRSPSRWVSSTVEPRPLNLPIPGARAVRWSTHVNVALRRQLVVGGTPVPSVGGVTMRACRRLAEISQCDLLELMWGKVEHERWAVCGVSPLPTTLGGAGLAALIDLLERRASRRDAIVP